MKFNKTAADFNNSHFKQLIENTKEGVSQEFLIFIQTRIDQMLCELFVNKENSMITTNKLETYQNSQTSMKTESTAAQLVENLVQNHNLSRRQAEVALKCGEGLSNAEISTKLLIRQETVKFHLRNIFLKLRIKRRSELIAYLFQHELTGFSGRS